MARVSRAGGARGALPLHHGAARRFTAAPVGKPLALRRLSRAGIFSPSASPSTRSAVAFHLGWMSWQHTFSCPPPTFSACYTYYLACLPRITYRRRARAAPLPPVPRIRARYCFLLRCCALARRRCARMRTLLRSSHRLSNLRVFRSAG